MIIEKQGNIVNDTADVLVCTTNCVGVMGKGIALAFKNKWPSILKPYQQDCLHDLLQPGSCKFYQIPEKTLFRRREWVAFCTKNHWNAPSRYEWIATGLKNLYLELEKRNRNETVAIPRLGCGNGGLDWKEVKPMMYDILEVLPDVRIYV